MRLARGQIRGLVPQCGHAGVETLQGRAVRRRDGDLENLILGAPGGEEPVNVTLSRVRKDGRRVLAARGMFAVRLILLHTLITETTARYPEDGGSAGLSAAYRVLSDLQQTHPDVVTELLSYPHTGTWLAHVLRRLDAGGHDAPATPRLMRHRSGSAWSAGDYRLSGSVRRRGRFQ